MESLLQLFKPTSFFSFSINETSKKNIKPAEGTFVSETVY